MVMILGYFRVLGLGFRVVMIGIIVLVVRIGVLLFVVITAIQKITPQGSRL